MASVELSEFPIESYAGYLTVNKNTESNLFFWYFPATNDSINAPVLLWLQGGPGASSLFGLFYENGPFSIDANGYLTPRLYSWNTNHNLIYIDNPVGTGFSFTYYNDAYVQNEIDIGRHLLNALQQFFQLFPNLQNNEFFVAGESYAGKYIPALGNAIHIDNRNEKRDQLKPKINLKGMAIGNGCVDPIHQIKYGEYLFGLGLIDSYQLNRINTLELHTIECMRRGNNKCAYEFRMSIIDAYKNFTGKSEYNYLQTDNDVRSDIEIYLNKITVQDAIHAKNINFYISNPTVQQNLELDRMNSVTDWISELLSFYPILFYNGRLDVIAAYELTRDVLVNLNFSAAHEFKMAKLHSWRVGYKIAGFVTQAGNLTEISVKHAGHMVPHDQPKNAFEMITKFTHHKSFIYTN